MTEVTCSEGDCSRRHLARGLCQLHYQRWWNARGPVQMELPDPSLHRITQFDDEALRGTCSVCGPVAYRLRTGGRGRECRTKKAEYRKRFRQKKHNLSDETRQQILASQDGLCAICRIRPPTVVDHDHACCPGKGSCGRCIRGLLCHRCNVGLGWFDDNPASLGNALVYLDAAAQLGSAS